MGFLDNLLNKSAKKIVSDIARTATDAVSGELSQSIREGIQELTGSASATTAAPAYAASTATAPTGTGKYEEVDDKLRAILSKEFPQYEVRENVSPETLGGTGKFMPYSFGIYENSSPKLFIMVVYNNTCASRTYRWSKEEAAKAGIPLINFVYAFENRTDYITNRLHQYL